MNSGDKGYKEPNVYPYQKYPSASGSGAGFELIPKSRQINMVGKYQKFLFR